MILEDLINNPGGKMAPWKISGWSKTNAYARLWQMNKLQEKKDNQVEMVIDNKILESIPDSCDSISETISRMDGQTLLKNLLSKLDEKDRKALMMFHGINCEEHTKWQIAEMLGETFRQTRHRLVRISVFLRETFQEEYRILVT